MPRSPRRAADVLAIDTNVVVRYLVDDDHEQFRKVESLIRGTPVFVANTVVLECEWVMRTGYGYSRREFIDAIQDFAGLPNVELENPRLVATALVWHADGMDFADALHLGQAAECDAFVSFDKRLAKAAAKAGAPKVRAP